MASDIDAREEMSRARERASFDRSRRSRTLDDDARDDARDDEEEEEKRSKTPHMLELEYEVRRRVARDAIKTRDELKTRVRDRRRLTPDAGIREHVVE